jgi:hypothetical protein
VEVEVYLAQILFGLAVLKIKFLDNNAKKIYRDFLNSIFNQLCNKLV